MIRCHPRFKLWLKMPMPGILVTSHANHNMQVIVNSLTFHHHVTLLGIISPAGWHSVTAYGHLFLRDLSAHTAPLVLLGLILIMQQAVIWLSQGSCLYFPPPDLCSPMVMLSGTVEEIKFWDRILSLYDLQITCLRGPPDFPSVWVMCWLKKLLYWLCLCRC